MAFNRFILLYSFYIWDHQFFFCFLHLRREEVLSVTRKAYSLAHFLHPTLDINYKIYIFHSFMANLANPKDKTFMEHHGLGLNVFGWESWVELQFINTLSSWDLIRGKIKRFSLLISLRIWFRFAWLEKWVEIEDCSLRAF